MPEGTVSEQAQGGAGAKALHERFGFDSEDAMAEAFETMKADLKKFKSEARSARELEQKLAELEAERKKATEAEMTESQKLAKRLAEMEAQMAERDAAIRARDRALLMERYAGTRLAGLAPEEAAVLRDLYSAAVAGQEYADEADLAELLSPVDQRFAALRARIQGGQGVSSTTASGGASAPGVAGGGAPAPQGQAASARLREMQGMSFAEMVTRARAGLLGKKGS